MARRASLTQEQLDRLREEYEAWNPYDPEGPSAHEIAARHGVSKNTMYTWRSRGWRLDGHDGEGERGWKGRSGSTNHDTDLSEAVSFLTEELVKARIRILQLEEELDNAQSPQPD